MSPTALTPNHRERELAAIIRAYSDVTEQLKGAHETLNHEVSKLRRELEHKNRELERRERLAALGEMATGVAHEIRNPLGSIQLYASLLERDLAVLPKSQRLVRRISAGVEALDRIVGEVLDFAGHQRPNPRRTSLWDLTANVVEVLDGAALRKNVALELDPSVHGCSVFADAAQLERAVLNVVINALEASGQGGTVRLTAERDGSGCVLLHVVDSGPGVSPDLMNRIFNPFFTTKDTGTGLGLAIVHRVLESNGGAISVQNLEAGGAQFTLQVPEGSRPTAGV